MGLPRGIYLCHVYLLEYPGIKQFQPLEHYLILQALRESSGTAVTVSDNEIQDSLRQITSFEGIFACPEGAATLAGLKKVVADGILSPDEKIVLMNTGTGLKYLDAIQINNS